MSYKHWYNFWWGKLPLYIHHQLKVHIIRYHYIDLIVMLMADICYCYGDITLVMPWVTTYSKYEDGRFASNDSGFLDHIRFLKLGLQLAIFWWYFNLCAATFYASSNRRGCDYVRCTWGRWQRCWSSQLAPFVTFEVSVNPCTEDIISQGCKKEVQFTR